jgi:hypothetical protein
VCTSAAAAAAAVLLLQASPHVQFALALSSCLLGTNYARLMRLLEAAPMLLAAAGQVRAAWRCGQQLVNQPWGQGSCMQLHWPSQLHGQQQYGVCWIIAMTFCF